MTTPGFGGIARANESGKQGAGGGPADATLEPGAYSSDIFGIPMPQGTGAPGSQGASGAADPTNMPGELTEGISGMGPDQTADTGAPGSAGVDSTQGGGQSISYTDPGSYLGGTYQTHTVNDEVSGPRDWTQAADDLYTGDGNLPGIKEAAAGLADTGAGGGHVMRGGRAVNL